MLSGRKISLHALIMLTFLLCLSCSCRRIKRELGIHVKATYRWCWWLRNVAISYEVHRQLEGIVEADEIYQFVLWLSRRTQVTKVALKQEKKN
jgi:hypothetical protein